MNDNEQRLGVLIATLNEKIERVARSLLPQVSECRVLISHQVVDGFAYDQQASFVNQNVSYSQLATKGLSKNRNNCLAHTTQDINVFADDDVEYVPDFDKTILREYASHNDADVITFHVERGHHKEKERRGHFQHTNKTIHKVPSIGITFRKESLDESGVVFDERFGIGGKYKSGEQVVFLHDCLQAGLKVIHVDTPIVRHTHLSSGWIWDKEQVAAKIATVWKVNGPITAFFAVFSFTITKRSLYSQHMGMLQFLTTAMGTYLQLVTKGV